MKKRSKERSKDPVQEARNELEREFFSLLVVYLFLAILPLLTGFACQS